jgi:hypothetical protein
MTTLATILDRTRDLLLGCTHSNVSWPQGRGADCHINCNQCGKRFRYDWRTMRTIDHLPKNLSSMQEWQ